MRMLYYPPQDGDVSDSTIGIGAHTELVFVVLVDLACSYFTTHRCNSYEVSPDHRVP